MCCLLLSPALQQRGRKKIKVYSSQADNLSRGNRLSGKQEGEVGTGATAEKVP